MEGKPHKTVLSCKSLGQDAGWLSSQGALLPQTPSLGRGSCVEREDAADYEIHSSAWSRSAWGEGTFGWWWRRQRRARAGRAEAARRKIVALKREVWGCGWSVRKREDGCEMMGGRFFFFF